MHSINYGTKTIEFEILFSSRKTFEINVLPDKSVIIKAPEDKSIDEVLERVKKRSHWIVRQQRFFDSARDEKKEKQYISGETIHYLGKQYRLKIISLDDLRTDEPIPSVDTVRLVGSYLRVYTRQINNREHIKNQVNKWYRSHAEKKFSERFAMCSTIASRYQITGFSFEIREMSKRWGSHTPNGKIFLNPELIEYPAYCIDYVIIHELCHAKHLNHSQDFYNLLSKILPDWQTYKSRLEDK